MPFSANTFLIGAQRSGTTNLAHLLGFHPEISLSEPKEPVFYAKNWERGFDWYAERFAHKERPVILDASTWYSVAPTARFPELRGGAADVPFVGVPERIHSAAPEARFIYVVRDPVRRTNSLYWLLRHDDPDYRRFGSLRHAMESDPFMLRGSDYAGQIDNFREYFPQDRFLLLVFEEVVRDLPAALDQCFRFLDLDPEAYEPPRWSKRNESYRYTRAGEIVSSLCLGSENLDRIRLRLARMGTLGQRLDDWLIAPIPPVSDDDRAFIQRSFAESNRRLAALMGRELPWSG